MNNGMNSVTNEAMNNKMNHSVLACRNVFKTFKQGKNEVPVLRGIDFAVQKGETVAIVGSSGSGKSTLLHILGGLDALTEGEVTLMGERMDKLSAVAQGNLRNRCLGFIYQFHHLLPEFTDWKMWSCRSPSEGKKPKSPKNAQPKC